MTRSDLTRRDFLRRSALGASAVALGAAGRSRAGAPSDEVAIGLIGCGGRGRHLLRKTVPMGGVRVVAVCDLLTNKVADAQKDAQDHNPKGYTDFREMMKKEKLDGIIVATEVGNHAKVAVPVLEAGYPVFCEKPMDTTVERVDEFVRAARKAKGFCQIGFQRHYNTGYARAIGRVHKGDLGPPVFLQGQWHWTWDVGTGGWLNDMDLGGGELVEQAGHHMDVMAWVMNYQHPTECVAMANIARDIGGTTRPLSEDHSAVLFRFPGNVIFSYTHLFLCPRPWEAEKMWVYGRNWGVDLVRSELHRGDKTEPIAESSGTDWDKGTDGELEAFFDNIRKGGKQKPLSNIETARVATLMCFMGRQAFRDLKSNTFESRVVKWEDLGSTTEPGA